MRILHVIPAIASRYGGPSVAIVQMVRALLDCGVEAEVLTTNADGPARLEVPLGTRVMFEGVPFTFFRSLGPDSLKLAPGIDRWLDQHVKEWDLVHIHSVFGLPAVSAGRAARRAGVPYVVRPLGHLAAWSLLQKPFRKRVFWALGGRRLVSEATALHYTSLGEMEDARAVAGHVPAFVVPLGLTLAARHTSPLAPEFRGSVPGLGNRPFVLFLGRIHPKKGIEALIEGLEEAIRQPGADAWALVIAGDGDPAYVQWLQELTRQRLPRRAFWVGWLEGERKAAALSEAALFALISVQENFGISAFEAMAEGTPCLLGSGVDLAKEVTEAGAGWSVAPTGPAVGAALREILSDAEERNRRGVRATRLVRDRFSWPTVVSSLVGEYSRILGKRTPLRSGAIEGVVAAG